MASILKIARDALAGIGITPPSSLVVANDDMPAQLISLASEVASDMIRRADWQRLKVLAKIDSKAQDSQGVIPVLFPDFERIIPDTMWNSSNGYKISNMDSSQEWSEATSRISNPRFARRFRIVGDELLILGQTVAGEHIRFEYVSKHWLRSKNGLDRREDVKSNDDEVLFDADTFKLGLQWKWLDAKGLSYSEKFRSYEMQCSKKIGQEKPFDKISLTPRHALTGGQSDYPFDIYIKQ
jgi:hypothetical protein